VSNLKPFDFSLFSDKHLTDLEAQLREEMKRRLKLAQSYRELSERGGPVYRNPSNSAETWTGRATPPKPGRVGVDNPSGCAKPSLAGCASGS